MKQFLLAIVILILCGSPSWATEFATNQRLDQAISPEHDPKLIVAGTIETITTKATKPASLFRESTFSFSVQDVVLGDQKYKGQTLTIPGSAFLWPENLVALSKGTRCIFVLRTDWGENRDGYYICAVVPRSGNGLTVAKDGELAKRILEEEILAELMTEKRPARQRALLIQVSPILHAAHAPQIVRFLESKDVWVMRAALAALVYATEREEYIRRMASDVQAFFSTTKPTDLMEDGYAPYPYYFNYYFFLERSRWNEAEDRKHLRILNAMFETGVVTLQVRKILNPEPSKAAVEQ